MGFAGAVQHCCLGLIDNGLYKSTNRLLVFVLHERPHGIMRILENPFMLLPKALKMRVNKGTMALVADSIGGTKHAPAEMSWHLRHINPALLNRQGMSTHPKLENGSELCHRKGQLIVGLCVDPIRPCKPLQIGAKLGTPRGSTVMISPGGSKFSRGSDRVRHLCIHTERGSELAMPSES